MLKNNSDYCTGCAFLKKETNAGKTQWQCNMNDSNLISLNGKPTKSYSCRDANWYLKKPAEAQPGKTCTIEKKQLVFELNNIELNLLPSQTDDKKMTCSLLNFPQYLPEFARTNDNFDLALAMYKNGCKVTVICELE